MSDEQSSYKVVRELLSFASSSEGEIASYSIEEVNKRLQAEGIDLQGLADATRRRLQIIKNECEARRAAEQARARSQGAAQSSAPDSELAFAARTDEEVAPEDIELLRRLALPSDHSDGTKD
jgi:hypothetical protein